MKLNDELVINANTLVLRFQKHFLSVLTFDTYFKLMVNFLFQSDECKLQGIRCKLISFQKYKVFALIDILSFFYFL